MDARISQDVYFAIEELFEVLAESDEIEQRSAGLHVDEEIEIAFWMIVAACHGSEQADVSRAVLGCDLQDLLSLAL